MTETIRIAAFHPAGELFACITLEQTIEIRRVASSELLHTLSGHTNPILSLDFSPCEPLLASTGWDGAIRLWITETGVCLQTLRAPGPSAGMNTTGVTGITEAQKTALKALGAYEQSELNFCSHAFPTPFPTFFPRLACILSLITRR